MTKPFDDDLDDVKLVGFYVGVVTDRDDPKQLGRVRFRIPGLIEPQGPWARPLGTVGGGSSGQGMVAVPEADADIGVFFNGGDPEAPWYISAHWGLPGGENELPEEARRGGSPDNRVWSTQSFCIELDETEGAKRVRITDRTRGSRLEFDAENGNVSIEGPQDLTIKGTAKVRIESDTKIEVAAPEIDLGDGGHLMPCLFTGGPHPDLPIKIKGV